MLPRLLLPAALLLLPLAAPAVAQTTHFVNNGPGFDFTPSSLTVQTGDTVTWVWQGGVHTVYSATGGIPDGYFASGTATGDIGHTFSVTFDGVFLAANPVPGGIYNYICTIHSSFGQVGSITVETPSLVTSYGCTAPAGALSSIAGAPTVGDVWRVGVNNPFGTQGAGSLAFLAASSSPAAGFPCGLPLPGFGMSGPGATGELLIDLTPPNPVLQVGPLPYDGTQPSVFILAMPSLPTLVGADVYLQGVILDPAPGASVALGLTDGFAVTIGS